METEGQLFTIVTIYAPNNEEQRCIFFQNLCRWINDSVLNTTNIILTGDFNVCLCDDDRNTSVKRNDRSRHLLLDLIDELSLYDVWQRHGKGEKYTWYDNTKGIKSRIDYILFAIDTELLIKNIVNKTVITKQHGLRPTDHTALIMDIKIDKNDRGEGYWKLNTSLLQDKEYISTIINTIEDCKSHYHKLHSKILQWEMIKIHVKQESIKFSKYHSKQLCDKLKETEMSLEKLKIMSN